MKASGVGHSWWKEQFCSGNDTRSVNVVLTEQKAVLDFMGAPTDPQQWVGRQVPADFPVQVNEADEEVTVAAGVTQRVLLDYLSGKLHRLSATHVVSAAKGAAADVRGMRSDGSKGGGGRAPLLRYLVFTSGCTARRPRPWYRV